MNGKTVVIIAVCIVFAVVALGAAMLLYSYTQISVSLDDVGLPSIDWMDLTISNLIMLGGNLLTGDVLGSALTLIDGIHLDLVFGLSNGGLLPVYVPSVTYDLAVNGIPVGRATSAESITINPGETKQITAVQNIKKSSLVPAISSIVESGGVVDIKVMGTAYFELLGWMIPVPFESSKQISIIKEIEKWFDHNTFGTTITLNVPKSEARPGDPVEISGRLTTDDGRAMDGMMVYIKDEDTGSGDDDIAIMRTDAHGEFYYLWTARSMDPLDDTVEIYAVFEGSGSFERARSMQYDIIIADDDSFIETQPRQRETSSPTSINLIIPYTTIMKGDILEISGQLVDAHGYGLQNALVYIKDEDTGSGDDDIAVVRTDAHGEFYYLWTARSMDTFDDIVEIYAVFEGSGSFERARSMQHNIIIVDDNTFVETQPRQRETSSPTSINLIIPHTTIVKGDILEISGRLVDAHGYGLQNALVYIKDEDAGSGDDDIAVVRTDAHGYFYYSWTARSMDLFDDIVEIYAVFEGSTGFGNSRSVQIDVRIN